jgi:hypothetical protein
MASQLGPFWGRVAPNEKRGDFLARTLGVAGGLGNPELATSLLEPFTLKRLTPSAASRLIPLADRYGLEWCVSTLEGWAEKGRTVGEPDATCLTSLPSVCRALCDGGSARGFDLARWLVTKEWARMAAHVRQLREQPNPQLAIEALSRMSKPILGLLEGSRISNQPELHTEMTRFLTSLETDYPIRGLVHLLRTAHETRPREALADLGLATVHGHAIQALGTRVGMSTREDDDWSISAPIRCRCRLCGTLARFLSGRDQLRLEWPLAKDQRAHIHQVIDALNMPVTHVTRRTGRPFTLVLVKTDALFEREAAERKLWQRDLEWLVRSARAFEARSAGVAASVGVAGER